MTNSSRNYFRNSSGYEKLPQADPAEPPRRWTDRLTDRDRHRPPKSEELVDNKKNEMVEKKLVENEKQRAQREKEAEKQAKKEAKEEKKKLKKEAKEKDKKS